MSIQGFDCKVTEVFFKTGKAGKAGWANVSGGAKRKLDMVEAAHILQDLASPPGNSLEALKDDLEGYHSIRINGQWRVVFKWTNAGPNEVRICDYH